MGQVENSNFTCRSEIQFDRTINLPKTGRLNSSFDVSNFQDHVPLYSNIEVFVDSSVEKSIDDIRNTNTLWKANKTAIEFNPENTYWAKIKFIANLERDGLLINVSPNDWDQSWNHIETWVFKGDSIYDHSSTGFDLSIKEKPSPSALNLIALPTIGVESITIICKLQGLPKKSNSPPDMINFWLMESADYPGLIDIYDAPGKFFSNPNNDFPFSPIINSEIWIDSSNHTSIEMVEREWSRLPSKNLFQTPHLPNTTYWMKTSFIGNEKFYGEQILHISSRPKWGGGDYFSFDNVDAYFINKSGKRTHQKTGDHVALSERPYDHWPNFLRLDLAINDTIDLFIRMEGADRRFLMSQICLYHIDKSSVYPLQIGIARIEGFFYGILIIQILFFFVLFLIEKEAIHGYFSMIALGITLVLIFAEDNFQAFVHFPTLRDYHVPLFFIGIMLLSIGVILFTIAYFKSKTSPIKKKLLVAFFTSCLLINCYTIYKFAYTKESGNPTDLLYVKLALLLVIIALIIAISIAVFSSKKNLISKKIYFIAFLPIVIISIAHWTYVLFAYKLNLNPSLEYLIGISNSDIIRVGIVSMLTVFAFSIGNRTNRLKTEKETALRIAEKNVIIAEKSKQNEMLVKEIHHRVKNNLQILSSLLSLQSDHLKDENAIIALQEGRNRVESMGLIHQRLYSNETGMSVDMKKYVKELCLFLEESFSTIEKEIRIKSDIRFELLDVDYAIPLGLIINELVTNSVKYAFQDRNLGCIFVSLWEANEKLLLKVADDGQGYTSSKGSKSTSFGSKLLNILSKKLKGTVEQITNDGFETTITFSRYQ